MENKTLAYKTLFIATSVLASAMTVAATNDEGISERLERMQQEISNLKQQLANHPTKEDLRNIEKDVAKAVSGCNLIPWLMYQVSLMLDTPSRSRKRVVLILVLSLPYFIFSIAT